MIAKMTNLLAYVNHTVTLTLIVIVGLIYGTSMVGYRFIDWWFSDDWFSDNHRNLLVAIALTLIAFCLPIIWERPKARSNL